MVCLRFCQHSDVTFLKEFQQCLNSRYLTSTCLSLYTLHRTSITQRAEPIENVLTVNPIKGCTEINLHDPSLLRLSNALCNVWDMQTGASQVPRPLG